jgi:hypothetical protein
MAKGLGFFQQLFASLFGGNDPEAEKKRLLRSISKELSKTKYHFYKYGSNEVEPALPKYVYEIYKQLASAQTMFQTTNPTAIKNVVISSLLTEKQNATLEEMTEENIEVLSHTMGVKELSDKMQRDIDLVISEFENGNSEKIDDIYNKIILFKNFCTYDFYFLLRKFDSGLREHEFGVTPSFQTLNGTYVCDDLKNFIAVAWALPFDDDWSSMFQLLKQVKGVEPVSPNIWKKMLSKLKLLRNSRALEMMIQLISSDPSYSEQPVTSNEHIVEPYITQLENQVKGAIKKIEEKQTLSKVDNLLSQIFGNEQPAHLKNYTESASAQFEKKNLGSFIYTAPLGYLKAFLLDYTKKDLRELSDILLVRGKWATAQLSAPMSDAYNKLLELSLKITAFDDSLSEDVDVGLKLKTLLPRTERDRESANIIRTTLRDTNSLAGEMLSTASENYVIYARNLKMLLEDCIKQPRSEVIINWKELQHYADQDIKTMGVAAYKKIYLFVSLLQNFPVETKK